MAEEMEVVEDHHVDVFHPTTKSAPVVMPQDKLDAIIEVLRLTSSDTRSWKKAVEALGFILSSGEEAPAPQTETKKTIPAHHDMPAPKGRSVGHGN